MSESNFLLNIKTDNTFNYINKVINVKIAGLLIKNKTKK